MDLVVDRIGLRGKPGEPHLRKALPQIRADSFNEMQPHIRRCIFGECEFRSVLFGEMVDSVLHGGEHYGVVPDVTIVFPFLFLKRHTGKKQFERLEPLLTSAKILIRPFPDKEKGHHFFVMSFFNSFLAFGRQDGTRVRSSPSRTLPCFLQRCPGSPSDLYLQG